MDFFRFIDVVRQYPQVWDRNCAGFRDRDHKRTAWERIGEVMKSPAATCKGHFKSLREKYVREREKQTMFRDKYVPWQHLDGLTFLDPHIVLRKQSVNLEEDMQRAQEYKTSFTGGDALSLQLADVNTHTDFDRTLIGLVRKASPIWNRKSNGYPSKQLKYQLWKTIAQTLNKDVNLCMTRWKGLREKYIRQRSKFQDGEGKWEFLDDMTFLDEVIQYRRKVSDLESPYKSYQISSTTASGDFYPGSYEGADDNSMNDSLSSDFVVKSENFGFDSPHDSSYDSGVAGGGRKRSASEDNTESLGEKRALVEEPTKTPEQMFGDLVAAMLAKKTDRDKNIAMIEIMQILTK